jgi:Uma2 family endonuclease
MVRMAVDEFARSASGEDVMTTRITTPLPGTLRDPLYPDSDAEAVGESDFHMLALILLREALEDFFAAVADVYVASDMFWYWEQGNPRANRSPDVLVARGVGKHPRRSFRGWEENARPCVLFEIASERTWREDVTGKVQLYARLKVPEYFVFDPEGVYVEPPLQGFRLSRGQYVPLRAASDGSLISRQLGLRLIKEETMLRLRHARTDRRVLTRAERAENAERRTRKARQETQEARQRLGELQAEVERLRRLAGPANRHKGTADRPEKNG